MTDQPFIYKILRPEEWAELKRGEFHGSAHDRADGFIHFSTRAQLPGTLAKHYAGQGELILAEIEVAALPQALTWEAARGGDLFPHLYTSLPLSAVRRDWRLHNTRPNHGSGGHSLPDTL